MEIAKKIGLSLLVYLVIDLLAEILLELIDNNIDADLYKFTPVLRASLFISAFYFVFKVRAKPKNDGK